MKLTAYSLLSLVFLTSLLTISGCQKSGDPGLAGANGSNGTNGSGFEKAIKNGSILIYLDGKTPGGTAFKDTLDFRFSSGNLYYSSASQDVNWFFQLRRFISFDSYDSYQQLVDYTDMTLEPSVNGSDTTFLFTGHIDATVTTSDYKYFRMNEYYYNTDGSNFTNEIFTGFKYESDKGHLYYRFGFTSPANQNGIGKDLNVSGVVDVIVYQ